MPPKRKPAAASSAAPKPAAKRRSKLAKEHDISADEEAEIIEAFALFANLDESKNGQIQTRDLRRCLVALNAPPANAAALQELIDVADPDDQGWIDYEHFLPVAALQMSGARDRDEDVVAEEVDKAFRLFTQGDDRPVTLADLKRVAKELREDVPDQVLKDMVREATGGGLGTVQREDFEAVMRRAGVFG